ncbi:MAG TPA: hypothetical protein VNN17_11055, partial [Terriglobia bacterium]|nr:hypothetical protein [Terriglobia bacterium]
MVPNKRSRFVLSPAVRAGIFGGLALAAVLVVMAMTQADPNGLRAASAGASRRPTGAPQLVAVEPLPPGLDGEMCQWEPASAGEELLW